MSNYERPRQASPSAKCLGCEVIHFDENQKAVRVACTASPQFASESGFIQGGFLIAMLDEAMGYALAAASNDKLSATSISMTTDFLRPVGPGPVVVEAKITSLGRTIVFFEAVLFDAAGKTSARATSSCKINH